MKTYHFRNFPVNIGRYRVDSVVGRGAMGVVYKGFDEVIERVIALKFLKLQAETELQRSDFLVRFKQEAKLAAQCLHPNIITIFDYIDTPDYVFIVMEYAEGLELRALLNQKLTLPIEEASLIILQVLEALKFAHDRGIVHRDIKPSNVLILETGQVKVADFGIAKMANNQLTQQGYMVGTPNYMSPEAKLGQAVDKRSDLFAVGIVLFELLTGYKNSVGQLGQDDIDYHLSKQIKNKKQKNALLVLLSLALHPVLSKRIDSADAFSSLLKDLLLETGIQISDRSGLANTMVQAVSSQIQQNSNYQDSLNPSSSSYGESFSIDLIREIQQALVPHIGPVSTKLVRNYARKVKDFDHLVQVLSQHIPNEDERSGFVRSLAQSHISSFRSGSSSSSVRPDANSVEAFVLSTHIIKKIENAMIQSVGPMGAMILRKALKSSNNSEDLVSQLISTVPNTLEASMLRDTVHSILITA